MKYEYTSKNSLEEPQTYSFAQYHGKEFLDWYKESRREKANRNYDPDKIMSEILKKQQAIKLENATKSEFITKDILITIIANLQKNENLDTCYQILSKFIKKYEVFKRLFTKYNNFKKSSEDFKDLYVYQLFSLACLLYYKKKNNLKFLNCTLKLNDMLCSIEINENKELLSYILELETKIVEELILKKRNLER